MEGTIYSLIPAVLMLILVILTRKVLLSLGAGIIVGALFIHDFNFIESLQEIWNAFYGIFISDGELNKGNLLLLGFLLLLGMMTAFLQSSGGSRAFGEWMMRRVKTRRGAGVMSGVLGIIIFIDDYFNSLAVGQIARPLTDRYKISRAKLAYFIDSTSAPVTVISPISSWGAYIIGIMGAMFAANGITDMEPLTAFIQMIPHNFYALGAIILVFMVAYFKLDIGPMRKHEERAIRTGELLDPSQSKVPGDLSDEFKAHQDGKVYHLLMPIIVLIVGTVLTMVITGANASGDNITILTIFANTNVNLSLFIGGVAAIITSLLFHVGLGKPKANVGKIIVEGIKTMLPAIYILILAWMIGSIIDTLETGLFLAEKFSEAQVSSSLLPVLFFIIAGFMALATGTSWGTFGIMLPIAAEIAVVTDMDMLLPSLAAVLAGSVFGDHCSPISDTTILSSTGAGANHIDHVLTQLPYALIVASVSIMGYLLVGFTHQIFISLFISIAFVIMIGLIIHSFNKNK
ncbi:Na+/H+ antiporter NhaC family protein [Oceanobacillus bengalensis]|uniref:Na+/H+ antiporter NhaC family protein n=1 Tax=Oceanobacillus bengalensis TaxID=1435466 RepID=A0A494YRG1_9BACI|nr:Na+/H+ antiporter NhaC family protein [Oceanobacillus bengalensis]RKQ11969.1 Na+/H+ antiporter NhaC family protein [Oceanobacillus bengalensis]